MKMHKHFARLTVLFFVLTLISGHMKAMEATEIARIMLNGWHFLTSTIRDAHAKASLDTIKNFMSRMVKMRPAIQEVFL